MNSSSTCVSKWGSMPLKILWGTYRRTSGLFHWRDTTGVIVVESCQHVWGLPTADMVNPAVGQGNTGHTVSATQDYGGCPTFHSTNIKCIHLILNSKNIYQQYFKILDCVHFQLSPSTVKHPLRIYQNITKTWRAHI